MHCFYTERENIGSEQIHLSGADVNHIKNVLRMTEGEKITICDGEGTFYQCRIKEVTAECVEAEILESQRAETELGVKITLFQGLPKKDKMELIIQKAVELGAAEIVPVATRFCVAKIEDGKKEKKKLERWQAISEAAAKQSGRGRIPEIKPVMSFKEALKLGGQMECAMIPYERAEGMKAFQKALKDCQRLPEGSRIGVFIGPEGGFDEKEMEAALEAGVMPVSLGKRILRTETAGLCVLSALMISLEAGAECKA